MTEARTARLKNFLKTEAEALGFSGLAVAAPDGADSATVRVIGVVENQAPTRALTAFQLSPPGAVMSPGRSQKARRRAREKLARLNLDIDVEQPVGSYSVAVQQLVAIAHALDDETSVKDAAERIGIRREVLHRWVKELRG